MPKLRPIPSLVFVAITASGCVHSMQVRNLDDFKLTAHSARRHTVLLDGGAAANQDPYAQMIRDGLMKHASVERVLWGDEPTYGAQTDATVHADVKVRYSGSGLNFPITFPGFLIFTHAWNGYVYKASITTELSVTSRASGVTRSRTLQTNYDMRHCDFGRGFWSSSGWFLPGWGATSVLAGLYMINYDEDATPLFSTAVHDAYGSYIANNVAELLTETETAEASLAGAKKLEVAAAERADRPLRSAPAVKQMAPAATVKPPVVEREAPAPVPAAHVETDDEYNARVAAEQAASPR